MQEKSLIFTLCFRFYGNGAVYPPWQRPVCGSALRGAVHRAGRRPRLEGGGEVNRLQKGAERISAPFFTPRVDFRLQHRGFIKHLLCEGQCGGNV